MLFYPYYHIAFPHCIIIFLSIYHHHSNTGWCLCSFPKPHSHHPLNDTFQRNLKVSFTFTNLLLQLMCFFNAANQTPLASTN